MAYHAKGSSVYHIYDKCTKGNNIEKGNEVKIQGPPPRGMKLCKECQSRQSGR